MNDDLEAIAENIYYVLTAVKEKNLTSQFYQNLGVYLKCRPLQSYYRFEYLENYINCAYENSQYNGG